MLHMEQFTTDDGRFVQIESYGPRSAIKRVCIERGARTKCSDEYREDVDYFASQNWQNMPERLNPDA